MKPEHGEFVLRVAGGERRWENAFQRRKRRVAPHAVGVLRTERIDLPALGARVPGVALLRLAQRHPAPGRALDVERSEEHTSELQSQSNLVCRLLLEKKKN